MLPVPFSLFSLEPLLFLVASKIETMELKSENPVCGESMGAGVESPLNLVRGPARRPEWAHLIRLGGDRVAVLFEELRKSIGKVDGIVERLRYLESKSRWVVQYEVGDTELCTMRISPGLLEAEIALGSEDVTKLSRAGKLEKDLQGAGRDNGIQTDLKSVKLALTDRWTVRQFAGLVAAKSKLVSRAARTAR